MAAGNVDCWRSRRLRSALIPTAIPKTRPYSSTHPLSTINRTSVMASIYPSLPSSRSLFCHASPNPCARIKLRLLGSWPSHYSQPGIWRRCPHGRDRGACRSGAGSGTQAHGDRVGRQGNSAPRHRRQPRRKVCTPSANNGRHPHWARVNAAYVVSPTRRKSRPKRTRA
jgi:hypothetical protein